MPKSRKRKQPISHLVHSSRASSVAARSCRTVIRRFHVLLKRKGQLEKLVGLGEEHEKTLVNIDEEIDRLGGLKHYQKLSCLGQSQERGGGSEKVLIEWMKALQIHHQTPLRGQGKARLLEVGALKPDNYRSCSSWLEWLPIDLHSRHPSIREQDFLLMNPDEHRGQWDVISLSLVLNFVPKAPDRGHMLRLAYDMLRPQGLLFLALPLPCVANSRYLTFEHLESLMLAVGFQQQRDRWRPGGRMGYWLYQKQEVISPSLNHTFNKKLVLRSGHRNNFAILLVP